MPDPVITQDRFADHAVRARYPFRNMAVEDCAVFEPDANYRRVAKSAHMTGARYGMKFAVRRCTDKRIRVWRIA